MENFREVNDDILKEWFEFREDFICNMCDADKNYLVACENATEKILRNVPSTSKSFVENQLNLLDKAFMKYLAYWNEKCYRNGFVDGVQLIGGCIG